MHKLIFILLSSAVPFLQVPFAEAAAQTCSADGYTVVYINGISTTRAEATADTDSLEDLFNLRASAHKVSFLTGYNQTHLAGFGDKVKAVMQTYLTDEGRYIEDYDLKTILMETAELIETQKILLIGHSQGTFYTNAMYEFLLAQGYPTTSVAIYNLATPSSRVAGKGLYLTSSYDKVINYVREMNAAANAPQALLPNINIPIPYFEKDDEWAGHHFQSDYLEGAPGQIVVDINTMLATLKPWGKPATGRCFVGPKPNVAYRAQELAFATTDTISNVARDTKSAVANAAQALQSAAGNTLANAWYSVVPRPSYDAAAGGMPLIGVLYGTSIRGEMSLELAAEQKAEAAAEAARAAAEEEALRNAPRVEAWRPKPFVDSLAQAGAAALVFAENIPEPTPVPAPDSALVPLPAPTLTPFTGTPYQAGYGGSGECVVNCPSAATASAVAPSAPPAPSAPAVTTDPATTTPPAATSTPSVLTPAAPGVPALVAPACAHSLTSSACVLPTTSTLVSWDVATNTESYDIYINGALISNTTSTSTSITLTPNATSTVEVVARGVIGMRGTSTPLQIYALMQALRINEIAWAGTASDPSDQWLELYNSSGYALDLSHVALESADSSFYIPLSGTITAHDPIQYQGYYLIERREQAVNTVKADLVYAFPLLATTGETLRLVWFDGTSTSTLDATPSVASCSGWCAGRTVHALGTSAQPGLPSVWGTESMERIGVDGSLAASWQHNDTYNARERDVSNDGINGMIYGTPRLPNSQGWPEKGWYCGEVVSGTPTISTPSGCVLLMRFISPRVNKYVGYFIGTVGSSTQVAANFVGTVPQYSITLDGAGMNAGDHAFVTVWENRTNVGTDVQNFQDYFTGAATSGPPHTSYAVFEWVKQ
jgi:hypothetical protein